MTRRVDALVVGGGPAGAVAALLLARRGWRTLLVERGDVGRSKACGHCLNSRAVNALDELGLGRGARRLSRGRLDRVHIHGCDSANSQQIELPFHHDGMIADRSRLDQFLRDAAAAQGVEVLQPARVRFSRTGAGQLRAVVATADGTTVIEPALIVGADGLGSGVARAAALARVPARHRKYGFSFDVRTAAAPLVPEGAIEMFLLPNGYLGVINQGGVPPTLHVGGLISPNDPSNGDLRDPTTFVRAATTFHEKLKRIGLDSIDVSPKAGSLAIGPMPWRVRAPAAADPGVALVGDAAGYIEPFTGEGMEWAIRSAMMLDSVLESAAIGCWGSSQAALYCRLWRSHIARRQRTCRAMAFVLQRKPLRTLAIKLAAHWPRVTQRLAAQVVAA